MPLIVRPATSADEEFLREMLHVAIHVPAGEPGPPESIVRSDPRLAAMVDGFGTLDGDRGSVAEEGGRLIGAAWIRLLPEGYGFVADEVPELSLAVVKDRRGNGVGGAMLSALLAGAERIVPGVSLSCDDRNPAMRLYERFDFERIRFEEPHSVVMLRRFAQDDLVPMAPLAVP